MPGETGTVRLHRVLRAPTDRMYRAFLDKAALERWLPPYGFTGVIDNLNARVGGGFRMTFTNFGTGSRHSFTVEYLELVPGEQIKQVHRFEDENLPGDMLVSVVFKDVLCGTELSLIQEGIPSAIPVEMCYLGWQESLKQLARLVEPEIPDDA